jgi:hypothetical protein
MVSISEPRSHSKKSSIAALSIAIAYAIHAAGYMDYVADDGGISLAYARNLATGQGLTINPGGVPVEGYSNPVWVFLLALAVRTGLTAVGEELLLKGLGLIFGAAVLVVVPALARRAYGGDGSARWLAPAVLVVWTPFVFWSGGGLENAVYSFLLTLAAVRQLAEIAGPPRVPWSSLLLAAVAMTRPEGCAFFVAFLIHRIIATYGTWRQRRLDLALWALLFALLFGSFLLWRHHVFASWVPNTYYAKLWGRSLADLPEYLLNFSDRGWRYLIEFASSAWPVLAVAAAGLLDRRAWKANLLFGGILGGQALYIIYVGGDWWHAWRFMTPTLPFLAVAAQHGVECMARMAGRRTLSPLLAAALVVAVASGSADAWRQLRDLQDEDRLIALQGRRAQAQRIRALAAAAHIERPTYLEADIGGPALTGGLTIVDLGMLTDIHLARFQYFPPMFREYIFEERRPHFIRTHATWTRSSRVTQYPELFDQYLPITTERDDLGLHGEFVRKDLFVEPSDGQPAIAHFGEISLVSFEPRRLEAVAGREVSFTWRWRCDRKCSSPHTFEVVLDDGRGNAEGVVFDPVFGWYPTDQWRTDETIHTTQGLIVPARLRPGHYTVSVRARSDGSDPASIALGTLTVTDGLSSREESSPSPYVDDHRSESVAAFTRAADESAARHDYEAAFMAIREALRLDPANVRLTRRLEDLREQRFWIEYYGQTRRYTELATAFDREWAAGTLPADRTRLAELYFALLSAGDEARAMRVRERAGLPAKPAVTLFDDGKPLISLIDYRVELRSPETMSRLHVFLKVDRTPTRDLDLLVDLEPRHGTTFTLPQPFEHAQRWRPGQIVAQEVILWPPPGEYDIRVRVAGHDRTAALCTDVQRTRCEVPLGVHSLGQYLRDFWPVVATSGTAPKYINSSMAKRVPLR